MEKTSTENFNSIVLSGGGIRGIIQLGHLHQYIDQGKLNLDQINDYSGVSVGSIICTLLLIGYTPVELFGEVEGMDKFIDYKHINPFGLFETFGMLSMSKILSKVETLIINKLKDKYGIKINPTFKELYELTNKHLYVTVTNASKMRKEVMSHISKPNVKIIDALHMSCLVPFVFESMIYDGDYYVDGGLMDNFPITSIPDWKNKNVFGIIVYGSLPEENEVKLSVTSYIHRLILLPITSITETNYELARLLCNKGSYITRIRFDGIPIVDFSVAKNRKMQLFLVGYEFIDDENKKYNKPDDEENMKKTDGWDVDF